MASLWRRRRLTIGFLAVAALAPLAIAAQETPISTAVTKAHGVLDLLITQDFTRAAAAFDPGLKAKLSAEQLRAGWLNLTIQAGPFKQRVAIRAEQRGDVIGVLITCEFERSRQDLQMAFNAAGLIVGFQIRPTVEYSPPSYALPSAYTEREVAVGSGEWILPGTLTVPAAATGPVPAVVLVHGSGPADRDQSFGPNKPFRDLAWGLASQGVAVLRYDKRTRVHAAKTTAIRGFTVKDEILDDVLAAVEVLRRDPAIDATRIVVLGHSLGGMILPRIAAADARIAGFVVLAGAVRPLEESVLQQVRYLTAADGTVSPQEQVQIDAAARLVDLVRQIQPGGSPTENVGGAPASYRLDLRGYDAPAAARGILRPWLVLQGDRDYQVSMEDFAKWQAALAARPQAKLQSYPGLNHYFMTGTGPSLPTEYQLPGHVAEAVVRDIADWVRALARARVP